MTQENLFSQPVSQPFAKGSHTSWKAARAVRREERGAKTLRYLTLLDSHENLTDPEVHKITGWPRSSICSIRHALEHALLVTKTGQERNSPYGLACAAYRLTDAGRAALAAS
jgi:hypothetical protein